MPLTLTRRAGSPYWWISGSIGGRRIRESTGTDRRELAEEARASREAELYRSAVHGAPAPKITFAQAANSYLAFGGEHSPATLLRLQRLLLHLGAKVTCEEITQERLEIASAKLLRPGAKAATRLREIITPARAVLQHASRRGWCPPRQFDITRGAAVRTEWITPDEAIALVTAASKHLRPLLVFLVGTGARLGEALDLRWEDVDLTHARTLLRATKNGRDRIVDLCPRVLAALSAIGGRRDHVFRTSSGRPYAEKQVQGGGQIKTAWASAVSAAGITKHITPHSCRRTWASWHYAVHQDLLLLKRDGDWSSVALVERYARLVPETLEPQILAWRAGTITVGHQAVSLASGAPIPLRSGR
jgi:integrase